MTRGNRIDAPVLQGRRRKATRDARRPGAGSPSAGQGRRAVVAWLLAQSLGAGWFGAALARAASPSTGAVNAAPASPPPSGAASSARNLVGRPGVAQSAARPNVRVASLQPSPPPEPPAADVAGILGSGEKNVPIDAPPEQLPSVFPDIEVTPIDLASALAMVDVRNPQFLLAQQRVVEAAALRQLAATQILPTINLGTSYDGHTGPLQQSDGNILSVKRNSLYLGAGAVAIAAGTVNIPGLMWSNNPSVVLYNYLQSQQFVNQRQFLSVAERNTMGLRVASNYMDLLAAEGRRSILLQVRADAIELASITRSYAQTGQGRDADANRAATVLLDRDSLAVAADGDTLRASTRLAQLLGLDPSLRLHPTDNWVVPRVLVPEAIPMNELLAIAVTRRPELAAQQAAIRATLASLDGARMLPFSPTVFIGVSGGTEAGGSNLVANPVGSAPFASGSSRFGNLLGRTDEDYMAYWTLKNLGLGNRALIDAAAARMRIADWQRLVIFEQVRQEVANAYVAAQARLAQLITSQEAVGTARDSWLEDISRVRGNEGLPIEAVDSLRLLGRARLEYLSSIINYNRAQFELYVALGQPPADALVRTEPLPPGQEPRLQGQASPEGVMPLPPPPTDEDTPAKR